MSVMDEKAESHKGTGHVCDMRGMLSFMILWLLSKRPMYGQQLAQEIGKRKGGKPTAGTIYPALKELAKQGLVESREDERRKVYSLTREGEQALSNSLKVFRDAFGEIIESADWEPPVIR
jgi:PadR family transcriptional regulator PadR